MANPNPETAALLRAGRAAFRPTAADRDRVFSALSERLGEGPIDAPPREPATGAQGAGRFGRPGWRAWPFVAVPALGLGLGLILGRGHSTTAPSIPTAVAPPATVAVALTMGAPPPNPRPQALTMGAPPEPAPSLPGSSSPPDPPPEDRAPPPPSPSDRALGAGSPGAVRPREPNRADGLSEEVRLLSSAERELNHGRADDALRALTEHERRFPTGALAEERLAARVQALCLSGRRNEARLYLAQLAQQYPRSPHLQRARAVCSVGADSGP